MNGLSGGNGKWPKTVAFSLCKAQPRNESSVPAVSSKPKTDPVNAIMLSPIEVLTVPSTPSTFTSSPTHELIAEGVIVLTVLHAPPVVCSSEISGHMIPARIEKPTGPFCAEGS